MKLKLNLKEFLFQELFTHSGLKKLDQAFLNYLGYRNPESRKKLLLYRQGKHKASYEETSELLISCSIILESFVSKFLNIEKHTSALQKKDLLYNPIFFFKKYFVLKEVKKRLRIPQEQSFESVHRWLMLQIKNYKTKDTELAVASYAREIHTIGQKKQEDIQRLITWCVMATTTNAGRNFVKNWTSFLFPEKVDHQNLIKINELIVGENKLLSCPEVNFRHRDGFHLTEEEISRKDVLDQVNYCIYCHKKNGDFCSKGFPSKKGLLQSNFKKNATGNLLTGCPLEEKISEMNFLKKQGFSISALSIIMIDNPMCPATGHRICNDCMKSCIYQKQKPVNIPKIETKVLKDVLSLPWGVEIYDLFVKWNPLRTDQNFPKEYNGKKVMIAGMGPAGFTLSHHLLMEGCSVVGIDGLKIEPISKKSFENPIHDFEVLKESLNDRIMVGFGGVTEYGITVRWDKNFLKLIYISLLRRKNFQVFGSIRFGGTLEVEDVWKIGFDHLALCVGAGLSKEIPIENSLSIGMRQANDFLMSLQLTGASKKSSLANLQIRLPAVIIGGGLTGVDTATEVQAYYVSQVEKMLYRYRSLCLKIGENRVRSSFDYVSIGILDELLKHGNEIEKEREISQKENKSPDFINLIRKWGGVTIVYRKSIQESPAYRLNFEELDKAFEEGIYYAEKLNPTAVLLDEYDHISALSCLAENGENRILPARSVFVATGAQPNIAYEYEHKGTFIKDKKNYAAFNVEKNYLRKSQEGSHIKTSNFGAFTSYAKDNYRVSFLGDVHPTFSGSVVKAIASAKRTYPEILKSINCKSRDNSPRENTLFQSEISYLLTSKVTRVRDLNASTTEILVQSPATSRRFSPGQFCRMQNYEMLSKENFDTSLHSEGVAVLGIKNRIKPDSLTFIINKIGVSSNLISTVKANSFISVMGPTGAKTRIPKRNKEAFLIIGGLYAISYIASIGPQLKKFGNRIFFVGILNSKLDIYYEFTLNELCESIIWVKEDLEKELELLKQIPLKEVNNVVILGDYKLIESVKNMQHLKKSLPIKANYEASVYGPMQCMLKGVCAQCLQWQISDDGKRTKAVYSCSWQHQPMNKIDTKNIRERASQNNVQEILSNLWLKNMLIYRE